MKKKQKRPAGNVDMKDVKAFEMARRVNKFLLMPVNNK